MPEWDNLVVDYFGHNDAFFWLRGNQIYDEGNLTHVPPPSIDEDGNINHGRERNFWKRRNRYYQQNDFVRITSNYFYHEDDLDTDSQGKLIVERTSSDNNWSYQAGNIFVDPCVWGNARPMQIVFPIFYSQSNGKNIGELRFRLSPLPDRQSGIEGRIRAYTVPQKNILGAYQHGFNGGFNEQGTLNTTQTGNPYLGDIRTPFSYQGPSGDESDYVQGAAPFSGLSYGKNGISGQVQVLELYENGTKVAERECWYQQFDLRLAIYQPDSTTGAAKVFFGDLGLCNTFGIFHTASTSFLQHDELGNIGCAFPSYEVIRDYPWQNKPWAVDGANSTWRYPQNNSENDYVAGHYNASFHRWTTINGVYQDYMQNGRDNIMSIYLTPIQYSFENEIKSIGANFTVRLIKNAGSSLGVPYGDIPDWRYGRRDPISGQNEDLTGQLLGLFLPSYLQMRLNSARLSSTRGTQTISHAGGQWPNQNTAWSRIYGGVYEDQQRPRNPYVAWNSDPGEYNMKDFIKRSVFASPEDYSESHAPALGDKDLKADKISCKLNIDPFLLNAGFSLASLYHDDIRWQPAESNEEIPVGNVDNKIVGRFATADTPMEGSAFRDPWNVGANYHTGEVPNCLLAPGEFYGQRVHVKHDGSFDEPWKYWEHPSTGFYTGAGLYMWNGTVWVHMLTSAYGHADYGPFGYEAVGRSYTTRAGLWVTNVGRFTFGALNNRWLSFENKTQPHYGPSRTLAQGLYSHDKSYNNEFILADYCGFTNYFDTYYDKLEFRYFGPDWGDSESLPPGSLSRDTPRRGSDIYTDESGEARFAHEDIDNYRRVHNGSTEPPFEWEVVDRKPRRTFSSGTILGELNEKLNSGNLGQNWAEWKVLHTDPDNGQEFTNDYQLAVPYSYSFDRKGYLLRTQAFAHISRNQPWNSWSPALHSASSGSRYPHVSRYGPDQNDIDRDSETAYEKNTDGNLKHIHAYKFDTEQFESGSQNTYHRNNPPLCVPYADGSTRWGFKIYIDAEEYAENINGTGGQVFTNMTKTLQTHGAFVQTQLYPPSLINQLEGVGLSGEDRYSHLGEQTMAQLDNPPSIEKQQMTSTRIGVWVTVYLSEEKTKEFTNSKTIEVNFPIRGDDWRANNGNNSEQIKIDMNANLRREWPYSALNARNQLEEEGSVCLATIQYIPGRYNRSLEKVELGYEDDYGTYAGYEPIQHHPEYQGWELPTIFDNKSDNGLMRTNYGGSRPHDEWMGGLNDFNYMTRANANTPGSITLRLD